MKILLVEDEEIERNAIRRAVEENITFSHELFEAKNYCEAKKIIEEIEFNIILMDIKIPGGNGLDLCEFAKEKHRDSKVVIVTAYDEFEFAQKAIKLKVDDYLLKPVRLEKLVEVIENVSIRGKSTLDFSQVKKNTDVLMQKILENNFFEASIEIKSAVDYIYENTGDLSEKSEAVGMLAKGLMDMSKRIMLKEEDLRRLLSDIRNEAFMQKNSYYITGRLTDVLGQIFNERVSERTNKSYFSGNITAVLNYIEQNLKKDITLENVASYASISPYYLSKVFKKEMGITFVSYLTKRRIEMAKDMLKNTDLPIINIAIDLGYSEPNYFGKVFKKEIGISPTDYRNS